MAFEPAVDGRLETFIGEGPTRSAHSIELAGEAVASEGHLPPASVRQVYSEWEPSDEDQAFVEREFPQAVTSYTFARPAADDEAGWERALQQAAATVERSLRRKWWQFGRC